MKVNEIFDAQSNLMHLLKRKIQQGDVYVDAMFYQINTAGHKRAIGKLENMDFPIVGMGDRLPRYQLKVVTDGKAEFYYPAIDYFDKRYTIKNIDGKTTLVDR